jgi:hypothetical protein
MRRALASLKHIPAVLCGLLVVAWGMSCFARTILWVGFFTGANEFAVGGGSLEFNRFLQLDLGDVSDVEWEYDLKLTAERRIGTCLGELSSKGGREDGTYMWFTSFPIPLGITLLLPLVLLPFFSRFPLWSYFAWTALLAAELAYYLR